jgi:hypothetical protein
VNALLEAARDACLVATRHRLRACLVGGLAVQRWGAPRLTHDVDLSILAGYDREAHVIEGFLAAFSPRRPDARELGLRHRVLLLRSGNGVDVDISLGAVPFEEECHARTTTYEFADGFELPTCSAEDLVILKAVAGRPRDLADIDDILSRQFGRLELERIRFWCRLFADLKEDDSVVRAFEDAQAQVDASLGPR